MVEFDDEIYGCDYSSKGGVTATGDIMLIEGLDNAKQSITNHILTRKGTYPSVDTEYGSEIYEALGEDYETSPIQALRVYIQNALMDNPRVRSINRIDPMVTVDKRLIMLIEVMLVNGTEETLNLNIDEVNG